VSLDVDPVDVGFFVPFDDPLLDPLVDPFFDPFDDPFPLRDPFEEVPVAEPALEPFPLVFDDDNDDDDGVRVLLPEGVISLFGAGVGPTQTVLSSITTHPTTPIAVLITEQQVVLLNC